ncbi:unnamed protein product [Pleuronectes platessa]|uniref:Uncharacterized protein n=1 Tax=Pleuronectes platessa TaxID=8262 RepID=A0A9N7TQT3_PLEPL|nr:unnamed protein product [Pleuronectes platessa]
MRDALVSEGERERESYRCYLASVSIARCILLLPPSPSSPPLSIPSSRCGSVSFLRREDLPDPPPSLRTVRVSRSEAQTILSHSAALYGKPVDAAHGEQRETSDEWGRDGQKETSEEKEEEEDEGMRKEG